MRSIAGVLRPSARDSDGLELTQKSYSEHFSACTGIPVTIAAERAVPRLLQDVEMTLFRISQEALTNALKHANAYPGGRGAHD